MKRSCLIVLLGVALVPLLASAVFAVDATGASTQIDVVGSSSGGWASRILLIGFIATIASAALNRIFGIASIVAIPITFIIIGALLVSGPTILGPFMAAGATLR